MVECFVLSLQELLKKVESYYPSGDPLHVPDLSLLEKSYYFSEKAHRGQFRQTSGDPYIVHPLAVAHTLADMRLDVAAICAGLLHDCVEDTPATIEQIASEFGQEVASLVDGVTKLGQVPWNNRQERQAENFRKMLLAMARDIRVILIKLCDRLDNMRSLVALSAERQQRIARETMDIYAPLAHRLGIQWIKSELEDLSFLSLYPKEYKKLKSQLEQHFADRPTYLVEVADMIQQVLLDNGIQARVSGRIKHMWSIHQKTLRSGQPLEQLYDIIGFRALVPSIRECYGALGAIHGKWTPIPGRFKDFIALPKTNRYQSLHTTVIGPKSERIEIQLRTPEMHRVAEDGIAAHWRYKEGLPERMQEKDSSTFAWLHQLMEWQKNLTDPTEFIETVKVDLFSDEVFVFTPQGDVKALPHGATPIDFAYLIHTEVGHRCAGARVNGLMVPLHYELRNGDTVQIITHPQQHPNKDWLKFVASSSAKEKIRSALRSEQRTRSKQLGRELLEKECKKQGLSWKEAEHNGLLSRAVQMCRVSSVEDLLMHVGYGKILPSRVLEVIAPPASAPSSSVPSLPTPPKATSHAGILVAGEDHMLVRFARCCTPVAGDPIFGIITRGRGVTIHTKTCATGLEQDEARRVEVTWDQGAKNPRPVSIQVTCTNQPGLLAQLSNVFHQQGLNISQAHCRVTDETHAINTFTCRVQDVEQLSQLIHSLEKIPYVETVQRIEQKGA